MHFSFRLAENLYVKGSATKAFWLWFQADGLSTIVLAKPRSKQLDHVTHHLAITVSMMINTDFCQLNFLKIC